MKLQHKQRLAKFNIPVNRKIPQQIYKNMSLLKQVYKVMAVIRFVHNFTCFSFCLCLNTCIHAVFLNFYSGKTVILK